MTPEEKIDELTTLPMGWDGYRGQPVDPDIAEIAKAIMMIMATCSQFPTDKVGIVPGTSGSIQLEWHMEGKIIEVKIDGPGLIEIAICKDEDQVNNLIAIALAVNGLLHHSV